MKLTLYLAHNISNIKIYDFKFNVGEIFNPIKFIKGNELIWQFTQ